MGLDKALGILILCAVVMFVFFIMIRGKLHRNEEYTALQWLVTYVIVYLIFVGFLWGIVMGIWGGIYLIVR